MLKAIPDSTSSKSPFTGPTPRSSSQRDRPGAKDTSQSACKMPLTSLPKTEVQTITIKAVSIAPPSQAISFESFKKKEYIRAPPQCRIGKGRVPLFRCHADYCAAVYSAIKARARSIIA